MMMPLSDDTEGGVVEDTLKWKEKISLMVFSISL